MWVPQMRKANVSHTSNTYFRGYRMFAISKTLKIFVLCVSLQGIKGNMLDMESSKLGLTKRQNTHNCDPWSSTGVHNLSRMAPLGAAVLF